MDCFEPMRQFTTNTVLLAAAEKLFADTNSAWGTLPWKNGFGWPVVDAKLIPLPAYRALLCRELLKTNACGSVTLKGSKYIEYTLTNPDQGGGRSFNLPANSMATDGLSVSIRWGDWIAMGLTGDKADNVFDPSAPVEQRDEVIHAEIARLQKGEF